MKTFHSYRRQKSKILKDFIRSSKRNIEVLEIKRSAQDYVISIEGKLIYYTIVKSRNLKHTDYFETMLDKKSIIDLFKEVKIARQQYPGMEIRPAYLASYNDCMVFFDLTKVDFEETEELCPYQSAQGGNRKRVIKQQLQFAINQGKIIDYKND